MDILAVNYEYPPLGGGGGVIFRDLYATLAERHNVVAVTSAAEDLPRVETHGNLEIHRVPVLLRTGRSTATMPSMISFWPSSRRHMSKLIKRRKFDVVNSHFAVPSGPSAHAIAKKAGIPHVLSIHGGDIHDPSKRSSPHRLPVVKGLVRRLLKESDRVVGGSHNIVRYAKDHYGVDRDYDVIHLGIQPTRLSEADRPKSRAELGIDGVDEDSFVMSTIGRLVPRKNLGDLIHVVAEAKDPKVVLLVMGNGPMKEQWRALSQSLGIESQVKFLGFVTDEDKFRYLAASDAFVSTSMHEGFGLVFLEGMDQGCAIVSYNEGGQADYLIHGKTGGLVELGDRAAFLAEVKKLKDDKAYHEACRQHNLEYVQGFYIARYAERYEQVFREAIEARGQGSTAGATTVAAV